MNILFINSSKEWGGNEKWSVMAAEGLAGRGHSIHFAGRSDVLFSRLSCCMPVSVSLANDYDLVSAFRLAWHIRRRRIHCVIATKRREYFLGGLAARLAGAKSVFRLGINRPIRGLKDSISFSLLCDRVIVNSASITKVLQEKNTYDAGKCRVLYNAVEKVALSAEQKRNAREQFGIPGKCCVIAWAGRLTPQKRPDLALEAFAKLPIDRPFRLLCAGEGPQRSEYEHIAYKLGILGSVQFIGQQDSLTPLFAASDLFWLTSQSEGMPNVLMEAMAHGLVSVSFDVAGVREIVTPECGKIVPFGDFDQLATETAQLERSMKQCVSMGQVAQKVVQTRFTIESMLSSLEQHLSFHH